MGRVTMRDIAEVTGVSVMSVSNAFNRPDQLSEDLRARILARAAKMGYGGPHAAGRALRQGRANAYGVVFDDTLVHAFSDPFTTEWLSGFAESMAPSRSSIVLMSVPIDDLAGVESLRNTSVDGMASMCTTHPIVDAAIAGGLPVVAGDPGATDFVSIDERAAGLDVARHVETLGHRRIWVLVGAVVPTATAVVLPGEQVVAENALPGTSLENWTRVAGIVEGLAGCEISILIAPTWDRRDAERAAALALDRPDRPTAVVAISDILALGFIDAMTSRGLVPGRDLSVTGFDDIPAAAHAGLTTVRQPIREKGRLTAALLLDLHRQPRQIVLEHRLVVRATTGPVPAPPQSR